MASYQAHCYVDKGKEFSNCVEYDFNSFVPYCMSVVKFPHDDGTLKTLSQVAFREHVDDDPVALYRISVEGDVDPRLYRLNPKSDWYTHYDIQILDELDVEFAIIEDGEPNAMIWTSHIDGSEAFGFMSDLYYLRNKDNKQVKEILTMLWGVLTESHRITIPISQLKACDEVIRLDAFDTMTATIKPKNGRIYKHATARAKPFIQAMERLKMFRLVREMIDNGFEIHRINTDSILTNADKGRRLDRLRRDDNKLGGLKIKEAFEGKHMVKHIVKIVKL
jgi:hypothetical protein